MKLIQIEIDGFGKLVRQVYEFGPGLNLIYGYNEAGKSTLQRSILAALYGFFDEGSITVTKRNAMMIFEPWDSQASFGLKLTFELDEGMQYRVQRSFAPKAETILSDLKNGKSINEKFNSASQGRLFFAEELLGMPREVFENTSFVRQAELAALEKSASAITDTLLRLSASASQESTSSQAIGILETTLKEQVGTQRSRNKPLPEAQRRLESLQNTRASLQNEYQMLANQIAELAQAEESYQKLLFECEKVEYQRLLAQLQSARQQRTIIERADADVQRWQKQVTQYETWSSFPADARAKIQRLSTQYEKAQSDTHQAERIVHGRKEFFSALYRQLNGLQKTLNSQEIIRELPILDSQSADELSVTLQNWLDEELFSLRKIIQEQQADLTFRAEKLSGLVPIGHEGIAKDRQELGKLESELAQAKLEIRQIQQAASESGIPEEHWTKVLSDAQSNVEKRQGWMNFPVHLRDELLQLAAQFSSQSEILASKSEQISNSRTKYAQLQTELNEWQNQVSELESFRTIPHQEKPRIQEIASQLEAAKQTAAEANQQFMEINQIYQAERKAFELEKQTIKPLEELGVAGISQLQHHWLNASQQLTLTKDRVVQSQDAWNKVGMSIDEFHRLEKIVKEIQSGERPVPKPRRGCRSFFMLKRTRTVDQTPTEITIYSQVQPIYAVYIHQQSEVAKSESALSLVEDEIRQKFMDLIPDNIQENTFTKLIEAIQDFQQKVFLIEQRKGVWDTFDTRKKQAENHLQQIRSRLEKELNSFDVRSPDVENAVNLYFKACENKEKLVAAETIVDRLQSQAEILKQELGQYQTQHQTLAQTEEKITNLLVKAGIYVNAGKLFEGIQQFEKGLESHRQWRVEQSRLEQMELQIADFKNRLGTARSIATKQEEKLIFTRRQLTEKYGRLLPSEFFDQQLAQLDADLQSYNSEQSKVDKALGQLEQLVLQANTIQRDINDWAEKKRIREHLERDIRKSIHELGIEIDLISLADALESSEKAFQEFENWQQAKRSYEAAIQAQQAVRASLPKLETEIAFLEEKLAGLNERHLEWKNLSANDKLEVYDRIFQKLNDQALLERDQLTRLQHAVSREARNLRHLAELDEEIALVGAEVQRLSNFGQALELAISELTIATREFQKVFAPRLENIIQSGIKQITDGRYQQVKIDPNTLNIQVLAPERDEMVETIQLSTGTRDLVYLILRLGITQLMSSSGEKLPLFLDDPLVEFDAARLKTTLEYLKDLSSQTQILLFSKDDNLKNWLNNPSLSKSHYKVINLT